jgi:CRISPR/Cas system CSM-associated protein Csm3 (group 7 of RAMP superfamily)
MKSLDLIRCTIELGSPLIIGTGHGDSLQDAIFVQDANGLPVLPGTSIAGVLRDRWHRTSSHELSADDLFGHAEGGAGQPSRVEVSFGHIHDSQNQPVPYLATETRIADPLLEAARSPLTREHVRLGIHGAQQKRGLFDDAVVAAGHRFTFEVAVRDEGNEVALQLLALLQHPATRFGAKTRSGMGEFKVIQALHGHFDLSTAEGVAAFGQLSADFCEDAPCEALSPVDLSTLTEVEVATITLDLEPECGWLFGGGDSHSRYDQEIDKGRQGSKIEGPDMSPFTEPRVLWNQNRGRLDPAEVDVVIPASGIKGALRHRCAFYAYADAGVFAGEGEPVKRLTILEPGVVRRLFGYVPPKGEASPPATPGRVYIRESRFRAEEVAHKWIDHVSLDRFSGAPLAGRLFNEVALHGDLGWKLEIAVEKDGLEPGDLSILRRALDDLSAGDLAVGAGGGRGHGSFQGTMNWPAELEVQR